MTRNINIQFLNQVFVALWMLAFVSMGLVTAWVLLYLPEAMDRKGPGINIKEF
jgi:hypothetical protein